ncbi:unnamed protein product [Owenia fusiformis]|uniref:Uncharacterized protein n=1 Tax=Owenia fusiformis TaxID=6347 RepID=A0A8J1UMH4_OWEFU|nr:unnamed protein product [Owenia fusiformis]
MLDGNTSDTSFVWSSFNSSIRPSLLTVGPYDRYNLSGEALRYLQDKHEKASQILQQKQDAQLMRQIVISSVLCFVSLTLNIVSAVAVRFINGAMVSNHMLFLNLCLSNVLVSLAYFMQTVSKVMFEWSAFSIKVIFFTWILSYAFFVMFYCASAFTLLAFAVTRYLAIYKPMIYTEVATKKKVIVYLCLVWLASFLISIPGACLFFTKSDKCDIWNYIWPSFLVVTIIVIICLYVSICRYLRNRSARWCRQLRMDENRQALVTTLILMVSLIISLVPYFVFKFLRYHHGESLSYIYYNAFTYVPYINFILDPIIFGLRTRNIRIGYARMLYKLAGGNGSKWNRFHFTRLSSHASLRSRDSDSSVKTLSSSNGKSSTYV